MIGDRAVLAVQVVGAPLALLTRSAMEVCGKSDTEDGTSSPSGHKWDERVRETREIMVDEWTGTGAGSYVRVLGRDMDTGKIELMADFMLL